MKELVYYSVDFKNIYGNDASVLYQLKINYTDGTSEDIISDDSWKSSTGAITSSEIYHGETIDARLEKEGWQTATYDDKAWSGVKTVFFAPGGKQFSNFGH